jgi:hypothetical protein
MNAASDVPMFFITIHSGIGWDHEEYLVCQPGTSVQGTHCDVGKVGTTKWLKPKALFTLELAQTNWLDFLVISLKL